MACLQLEEHEIPVGCYYRHLATMVGDPSLSRLPIDLERNRIQAALRGHRVIGVHATTGSGKTMKLPETMLGVMSNETSRSRWPILLVESSIFGAEKVVHDLVETFHWRREAIHMRTGKHGTDKYVLGKTLLSVINYGILWRWLTMDAHGPIRRYVGILLDEFADLQPKQEQVASLLQAMLARGQLWPEARLVVTSASLQKTA